MLDISPKFLLYWCHGAFLDKSFKIRSFCLAIRHILGGHFANNLASNLKKIMAEFKIEEKVKHIVTDNAYNINFAIENLDVKLSAVSGIFYT